MGSGGRAITRRDFLAAGLGAAGVGLVAGGTEAAAALPAIPVFDAREVGMVGLARARVREMRTLLASCLGPLGASEQAGVVLADGLAKAWLAKTGTPYADELGTIAGLVGQPGVYLLNTSYEWGCTTLASPASDGGSARLLRTLDWSFEGLGRGIEAVRQRGPAGDFVNLTWPGAVGVLTALAPQRFAATINQAPPREGAEAGSIAALIQGGSRLMAGGLPSMHLLRRVFETAGSFAEARTMIETAKLAAPTIFTLAGIGPDETCVIERTETERVTHQGVSSAANTWRYADFRDGWAGKDLDLQSDSTSRRSGIERLGREATRPFAWVQPPVRNRATRLAVELDPARGEIWARGYEQTSDGEDAAPATADLHLIV